MFAGVFVLDMFGRRTWCKYLCPLAPPFRCRTFFATQEIPGRLCRDCPTLDCQAICAAACQGRAWSSTTASVVSRASRIAPEKGSLSLYVRRQSFQHLLTRAQVLIGVWHRGSYCHGILVQHPCTGSFASPASGARRVSLRNAFVAGMHEGVPRNACTLRLVGRSLQHLTRCHLSSWYCEYN